MGGRPKGAWHSGFPYVCVETSRILFWMPSSVSISLGTDKPAGIYHLAEDVPRLDCSAHAGTGICQGGALFIRLGRL